MMEVLNFTLILALQLLLLTYDIIINALIDLINPENVVQLVLFVVQNICLVFQLIVLCLEIFNTKDFQSGFALDMIKKFRSSVVITIIYLLLSIGLHVWTLTLRWDDVSVFVWNNAGYYVLYVIQRSWSIFYYYYYKRAALKMGNPKFYGPTNKRRRKSISA